MIKWLKYVLDRKVGLYDFSLSYFKKYWMIADMIWYDIFVCLRWLFIIISISDFSELGDTAQKQLQPLPRSVSFTSMLSETPTQPYKAPCKRLEQGCFIDGWYMQFTPEAPNVVIWYPIYNSICLPYVPNMHQLQSSISSHQAIPEEGSVWSSWYVYWSSIYKKSWYLNGCPK